MTQSQTDILISGAGIAGMILAAKLAQMGWQITIVDPAPPAAQAADDGSDLRSTAYLAPSVAALRDAGLWDALAPHATPLEALRVVDTRGWPPQLTESRVFKPTDLGLDTFGHNIPNYLARRIVGDTLADLPNVTLEFGVGFVGMLTRDREVRVHLTDGRRLTTRLVVGADGRASPVRQAAGIGTQTRRYGQKAFAFVAAHDLPHLNISTEIYNSGGAFTTVPMPDQGGSPCSAIVWMNDGPRAAQLDAADTATFLRQLNERSLHVLGQMRPLSPIRTWPIVTQIADRLTARRTVLLAEAAHVMPPIGAQGLNTSIMDIAALAKSLDRIDPGAAAGLARYSRTRLRDIGLRSGAIDLFNRVCKSDQLPVQALRRMGLRAVHDIPALRQKIMTAGMGG